MALPPKVCPECGEEYLHSASVCVHCEVPLVHGEEAGTRSGEELPPISQLQRIRAASAGWAVSLSERLREAAIPHRVEPLEGEAEAQSRPGREPPFGVFVRPEDVAAARRIDAEHLAAQVPDLPEGFDPGDLDAPASAGDACPACGEPVDPADSECRGCGIAFGGPE